MGKFFMSRITAKPNSDQPRLQKGLRRSNNVDMINGGVLVPLILYSVPIVLTQVLQLLF